MDDLSVKFSDTEPIKTPSGYMSCELPSQTTQTFLEQLEDTGPIKTPSGYMSCELPSQTTQTFLEQLEGRCYGTNFSEIKF